MVKLWYWAVLYGPGQRRPDAVFGLLGIAHKPASPRRVGQQQHAGVLAVEHRVSFIALRFEHKLLGSGLPMHNLCHALQAG